MEAAFASAQYVIEGISRVGGQDHFYLETQACIAVPKGEDGEMEILASTQGLAENQKQAASALGVPANRILVKVKRIGWSHLDVDRTSCVCTIKFCSRWWFWWKGNKVHFPFIMHCCRSSQVSTYLTFNFKIIRVE